MNTLRSVSATASLALLLGSLGCTTVSETGRKQFNVLPPDKEMALGLQAFDQMKKDVPISQNTEIKAMVEKVGRRIAEVVAGDMPNAQWEFVVFESEEANAFCLPGGKIGIYTGILPITRDESGMATVMGHEVAHAVARHGGERMSHQMAMQVGGEVLGALIGSSQYAQYQQAASVAYGMGAQVGVALPHGRMQESEADRMGLIYMARAGYDPARAVEFWERFAEFSAAQGDNTPWFLRTHPVNETRIEDLQHWLPDAQREYQPR